MSSNKLEERIQQECMQWFRNNYCLKHHCPRYIFFSVPNEGKDKMEQIRKKAIGMLSGVSDTIIVFDGDVVFCEFKDTKGRQRPSQIEFEEQVTALGFEYWVVRSKEDFISKVELYEESRKQP